jgi:hypothetical protein
MTEQEDIKESVPESAPEEQQEELQERQETESVQEEEKEDIRSRNLRLIAQAKEKVEQQNKYLLNEKKQLQEKIKKYESEYEDLDDTSDEKEYVKEIQELKEQQAALMQQMNLERAEKQIVTKYPDFADVVSNVNMAILQEQDTTLYDKIQEEPDIIKKADLAYKGILKHNIYEAATNAQTKKEAILRNMKKPRPAGALPKEGNVDVAPIDRLNSPQYQNELRRKAQLARSRL